MKNLYLFILIFFFFNKTQLKAQNVTIPDANFKAYLVGESSINTNSDGEIQVTEATAFGGIIYCDGLSISNMTGLEAFVNITQLNCSLNQLTSLNVSQNTSLTNLDCMNSSISSLDLSQNINLMDLNCLGNQLTSLDVSQNTNLVRIHCGYNQLTSLDVSQNTNLVELYCHNNSQLVTLTLGQDTSLVKLRCYNDQLTSLDVSQKINLRELYCSYNQLTSLNLSQNTDLRVLDCYDNQLTSLDLSLSTSFRELNCRSNPLTHLNLKNGNNTNMNTSSMNTRFTNVTCIDVDNVAYSVANWTNIDTVTSFSTNCNPLNITQTTSILDEVKLYPNPTTKFVQLDLGQYYESISIQVVTITGQVVLEQVAENRQMMTLELEGGAGVYFVSIQTEVGRATAKLLKE